MWKPGQELAEESVLPGRDEAALPWRTGVRAKLQLTMKGLHLDRVPRRPGISAKGQHEMRAWSRSQGN